MLVNSLFFILQTGAQLLGGVFLLRFLMQWARAPFRNPLGQFVIAASDWAVLPLRRVIPGLPSWAASTLTGVGAGRYLAGSGAHVAWERYAVVPLGCP